MSDPLAKMVEALLEHRADLHEYSTRPCPTCRKSAEALGIRGKVPDTCARAESDRAARTAELVELRAHNDPESYSSMVYWREKCYEARAEVGRLGARRFVCSACGATAIPEEDQ